jgi:(p)ppGpp synthase/HD superfamily hydrolase
MRTPRYTRRLDEAIALAVDAFRDRVRKQTDIPYVTHLLQVMVTVGEHGGDEEQMIAAVLHDYLEDIEHATVEEVANRFGPRVAAMVEALSDTVEHPKPPWRPRKEAYLARLRAEGPDLKLISAADKLHNARSIVRDLRRVGLSVFDRFSVPRDETLWYYDEVVRALGDGFSHPLLDELRAEVSTLAKETATAAGAAR